MSTAEILSLISTISYVIAAISFALAIFLWFHFRILSVIGDLSGRTAKKTIERMRVSNERASARGYRPSEANVNRGKLTATMQHSKKLTGAPHKKPAEVPESKAVSENSVPATEILEENKAIVDGAKQTELLDTSNATELLNPANETEALNNPGATELLWEEGTTESLADAPKAAKQTGGMKMTMLDEVMLVHTNEVIR